MNARVRGIYATAVTRLLLDAGVDVVQASTPIQRRFDADLPDGDHDATVDTTPDRQGVGVTGADDAVAEAAALLRDTGVDTLAWDSPTPTGSVFDGVVEDALGSGALVDLGDAEGFLPFGNVDGYVDEGDAVRVQVVEDAPPWVDDRPVLDTQLRAYGGLATLVAGKSGTTVEGRDDASGRELAGMTDLLGADVPDGWGVAWTRDATEASMDVLDAALARAVDEAARIEDVRESSVDPTRRLVSSSATTWVWFGRDSRFALDARRREVTTTMPGHHRIKAGSEHASAAVDFVEALCDPDSADEFPFAVVADQFGPTEGDLVSISHGKPDGRRFDLGRGEVVERDDDGTVAVRREIRSSGTYDALGVDREPGDVALTKFREGRWWYPTVYRDEEGERKGTYVNVCTPVECFPATVRYVDLHVDVVKHADGSVERVDDDELDAAVESGYLSEALAEKARNVASAVQRAL